MLRKRDQGWPGGSPGRKFYFSFRGIRTLVGLRPRWCPSCLTATLRPLHVLLFFSRSRLAQARTFLHIFPISVPDRCCVGGVCRLWWVFPPTILCRCGVSRTTHGHRSLSSCNISRIAGATLAALLQSDFWFCMCECSCRPAQRLCFCCKILRTQFSFLTDFATAYYSFRICSLVVNYFFESALSVVVRRLGLDEQDIGAKTPFIHRNFIDVRCPSYLICRLCYTKSKYKQR